MEMAWWGFNAASCFVKSLWDAVGLNCTAVGKLVYRGTGTSYLVMRLVVDGNWVVTSGFLFVGTGFSHWEFARGDWVVYETIFGGGAL